MIDPLVHIFVHTYMSPLQNGGGGGASLRPLRRLRPWVDKCQESNTHKQQKSCLVKQQQFLMNFKSTNAKMETEV